MFTYSEELKEKNIQKITEYFPDTPPVLFDIETTGLSRRACHIYLIGAIAKLDGTWTLTQWFLDHPFEEKDLIITFANFLKDVRKASGVSAETHAEASTESSTEASAVTEDSVSSVGSMQDSGSGKRPCLITFNGRTFDLPYLREKCSFYQLPDPFEGFEHCDLYKELLPIKKALRFSSMKQKDVERFLGIQRKDEKTGGELISVYQTYLRTKDPKLYDLLMLHNHDDILGLTEMLDALAWPEFLCGHKFTVEDLSTDLIPAYREASAGAQANACPPSEQKDSNPQKTGVVDAGIGYADEQEPDRCVLFALKTAHPLPETPVRFPATPYASLSIESKETDGSMATLCVRTKRDCLKHYYPDYRNYFYLPEEDQAVHKDVAIYVPAERRVKAKASTCYTKKTGEFLPQPSEVNTPAFYTDYKAYPAWFLPTSEWLENREALHAYCAAVIDALIAGSK